MTLSLVSVNIQRSLHLDRVIPFLRNQKPDVVCFQELCEADVSTMSHALEMEGVHVPMSIEFAEEKDNTVGVGIFTALSMVNKEVAYYHKESDTLPRTTLADPLTIASAHRLLLCVDIEKGGEVFRIVTTHFTWTPDGKPSERQHVELRNMLTLLDGFGEFVLCGDFNAPRGGEIFATLANRYKDNIPSRYAWSIDLNFHRAGGGKIQQDAKEMGLPGFMVDGLFTTPGYVASDVMLMDGISDHWAIVANINQAQK